MNEIVKVEPLEYGLEESKAQQVSDMFKPMLDKMVALEDEYNGIVNLDISVDTCRRAKELRLKYVKVRTGTAEIHKGLKDFYLKGGRFVDAWKNAQLAASQGKENKLIEIEGYYENIEKEKIKKIAEERTNILSQYNFESIPENIGMMKDDIWSNFLSGIKTSYELEKAAEEKADKDRLELERKTQTFRSRKDSLIPFSMFGVIESLSLETTEDEFNKILKYGNEEKQKFDTEQLRVKEENDRLKKENETAELKRLNEEKKIQAENIKIQQEHEKEIAKEREEREKAESELKRIEKEKELAKIEAEKKIQNELNRNDSERIVDLIKEIGLLKIKYTFKSQKFSFINDSLNSLINKLSSIQ